MKLKNRKDSQLKNLSTEELISVKNSSMLQMLQVFWHFTLFFSFLSVLMLKVNILLIFSSPFYNRQIVLRATKKSCLFTEPSAQASAAGASPNVLLMDLTRVHRRHKGKHCAHCTGPQLMGTRPHLCLRNIQSRDFLQKISKKKRHIYAFVRLFEKMDTLMTIF